MTEKEDKLIKIYQLLTQYLVYSLTHLNNKYQLVTELKEKQEDYNQKADDMIAKQQRKIQQLEEKSKFLNDNCVSLEFLCRHLGLEKMVEKIERGDN